MLPAQQMGEEQELLISLTADIVIAYIGNNTCQESELPILIKKIYKALSTAHNEQERDEGEVEKQKPAVNPKRSVSDDYIICLEDGKKFKSLKRHLMTHYNMTPEQYREKWHLDANYPMVAPNYANQRSRLARKMGLGHKRVGRKSAST